MSVWGEIKHAINSTLGTSNFKPLNELFDLYCGVKGSTNSADVLDTLATYLPKGGSVSRKIKMTGTITVFMTSNLQHNLQVYVNDDYVTSLYNSANVSASVSATINVKYGDVLKVVETEKTYDGGITLRGITFFSPMGGIIENV